MNRLVAVVDDRRTISPAKPEPKRSRIRENAAFSPSASARPSFIILRFFAPDLFTSMFNAKSWMFKVQQVTLAADARRIIGAALHPPSGFTIPDAIRPYLDFGKP